jgi:hypothetical protein
MKNSKVATLIWVTFAMSIAIIIYRKWKANQVKKNNTNY